MPIIVLVLPDMSEEDDTVAEAMAMVVDVTIEVAVELAMSIPLIAIDMDEDIVRGLLVR
jgi:hypothetical protein